MKIELVLRDHSSFKFEGTPEDANTVKFAFDGWVSLVAVGATPAEQAALALREGATADKLHAVAEQLKKLEQEPAK